MSSLFDRLKVKPPLRKQTQYKILIPKKTQSQVQKRNIKQGQKIKSQNPFLQQQQQQEKNKAKQTEDDGEEDIIMMPKPESSTQDTD